jgi:tetratricopeptide (TPR) repeat protein
VARHFQAAGQDQQAAEYYRIAGDYARSIYANAEALDHYFAALALGDPDRAALHEAIGDMQTLSGEYSAALHSYESAIAFREGQPQGELEAKVANVYARRGEWEQAESHYRTALDTLEGSAPCQVCSRTYGEWSLALHRRGEAARALQLANRALALADESGDAGSIAQAHNILAILARSSDDTAQALKHLEKSLELAEVIHDPVIRMAALNNLALVSMDLGEIEKGLGYATMALAMSSALGDRHRSAALYNNLADLLHRAGRPDEAMENLRQAVTIYSEIGGEAGTLHPEIWKLSEW